MVWRDRTDPAVADCGAVGGVGRGGAGRKSLCPPGALALAARQGLPRGPCWLVPNEAVGGTQVCRKGCKSRGRRWRSPVQLVLSFGGMRRTASRNGARAPGGLCLTLDLGLSEKSHSTLSHPPCSVSLEPAGGSTQGRGGRQGCGTPEHNVQTLESLVTPEKKACSKRCERHAES